MGIILNDILLRLISAFDFQNPCVVVKGTFFFCSPHVTYLPSPEDPSLKLRNANPALCFGNTVANVVT